MNEWTSVPLGKLGTVVTGSTPPTSQEHFFGGEIPFVTPSDLDQLQPIVVTPRTLTEAGASVVRLLPESAILISCIGSLGKVGMAGRRLATNQQINAVIFNEQQVWPRYGFYACKRLKAKLEAMAPATTVAIVSKSKFEALEIPLPPIAEQQRIAAILDQAERLQQQRQSTLDRLNKLGIAFFYEMFGDPVTNAKKWEASKLGEIGELDRGVSKHRPRNDPALLGGPYPLVQTGDIANADGYVRSYTSTYSELGLKQSKLWQRGTLCITIAANIGKTAILDLDACFPDSVVGFLPSKKVTVEYIQYWMQCIQGRLESIAPQSAQKNINLAILRALEVPLPPISRQRDFSCAIEEIERQKARMKIAAMSTNSLVSSLQFKAFRGEL